MFFSEKKANENRLLTTQCLDEDEHTAAILRRLLYNIKSVTLDKMARYREWDLQCKVYVGNLGSSASKHEIESAFGKYGPLRNVWVARNPPGFAFVEFEDKRDAEDAVRSLDGTRCCGTRIRVEMSSGRSRRDERTRRPRRSYR
uniref:Uncharacterized protein n=1 Tax=Anopheles arabiensis TaxID=7173 RepID=A0A182I2Z6_ANOAR